MKTLRPNKIQLITFAFFALLYVLATMIGNRYMFVFNEQSEKSIPGVMWYVDMEDKDFDMGAIIAFTPPKLPDHFNSYQKGKSNFVKYVKGESGDEIKIIGGNVYINDIKLTEISSHVVEKLKLKVSDITYTLDKDEIFVYGTHPRSYDSRYFGAIKLDKVIGESFELF